MASKRAALITSALVALTAAATAAQGPPADFVPDWTFQGSQLGASQTLGEASWRAENGVLVGTPRGGSGGWLVLDRAFQDVAYFSRFRCAGPCQAGVLLRAERTPQGMKGIFVSLSETDLGPYHVTLDNAGRELSREKLRQAGGQIRIAPAVAQPAPGPGLAPGQAAPPAAAPGGAGAAPASGGGGPAGGGMPATPAIRLDDWNGLQVILDANIVRTSLNGTARAGSGATPDSSAGYGRVALYVGGAGEVRYQDVALKDLNVRSVPVERVSSRFRMQQLDGFSYAWDAAVADINRDGVDDVVAGPYYYLGPDYTVRREIYLAQTFNPSTQYPANMVTHAADFTGDGWPDVLATEARPMVLYVNPRGESRRWTRHAVLPGVTTENTLMRDLDGDGKPEVVYGIGGAIAYAKPDPTNPTAPWPVQRISQPVTGAVNVHGLGVGDVNGDGRQDILHAAGWWEQPARPTSDGLWIYHPTAFTRAGTVTGGGGGEMTVLDLNGDGLNDVATSLAAHGWGLAWFEQRRDAAGTISFEPHLIMGNFTTQNAGGVLFSELHAGVMAADVDGDGLKDLITGKRYFAHLDSYSDPDPYGEAVLYWYRTVRNPQAPGGVEFVPELIHNRSGVGSQFEVVDLNRDGATDVVVSGFLGSHIFWGSTPRSTAR